MLILIASIPPKKVFSYFILFLFNIINTPFHIDREISTGSIQSTLYSHLVKKPLTQIAEFMQRLGVFSCSREQTSLLSNFCGEGKTINLSQGAKRSWGFRDTENQLLFLHSSLPPLFLLFSVTFYVSFCISKL